MFVVYYSLTFYTKEVIYVSPCASKPARELRLKTSQCLSC
jgi:hypothetical protein